MGGILTESQAMVWNLLAPQRRRRGWGWKEDWDPDEIEGLKKRFEAADEKLNIAIDAGQITEEQAKERLDAMK